MSKSALLITFFFLSLRSLALASNLPYLGDQGSFVISSDKEYKLGRKLLSRIRSKNIISFYDPQVKSFLEHTTYKLLEKSKVKDRRLTFIILDNEEIDAFVFPGGVIGITTGLFLEAESESEFAALIAHELAHLAQRHFSRRIEDFKEIKDSMMTAILGTFLVSSLSNNFLSLVDNMATFAMLGAQAVLIDKERRFSRSIEREADYLGVINLHESGYNPHSMVDILRKIRGKYRFYRKKPHFLKNHPITKSRIHDIEYQIISIKPETRRDSLDYRLMKTRIQMKYSKNSKSDIQNFQSKIKNNPRDFVAIYGLALAEIKGNQLTKARINLNTLLEEFPDNIVYILEDIELDIATNRLLSALDKANEAHNIYPESYALDIVRAEILLRKNNLRELEDILVNLLKNRKDDPDLWLSLTQARGKLKDRVGMHQARAEYFYLTGHRTKSLEQLDLARKKTSNTQRLAQISLRRNAIKGSCF